MKTNIAEVIAAEDADGLALAVHSEGILCATGRAAMPANLPPVPALTDFKAVAPRANRLPANEKSLPIDDWLGMNTAADHRGIPRPGRAGHPRNRSDLRSGKHRRSRNDHALLQLGADPQRYSAGMDPHGQHGAQPGLAHVGDTLNVRASDHQELRAQGPQMGGDRRHGRCQRNHTDRPAIHIAIYRPRQVAEAA